MKELSEKIKDIWQDGYEDLKAFFTWVLVGALVGVCIGVVGVIFHLSVEFVSEFRLEHPWILYLLPVGGIFIVGWYRFLKMEKDRGTNFILIGVRSNERVSAKMAPAIFLSTVVTHFVGGSAGREGAALQLGGSLAASFGRIVKMDEKDERIITMCGMSAAFAALFGTPITSVIFAMEVITVGIMHYSAIVPCMVSALIGAGVAKSLGIAPTAYTLSGIPDSIAVVDSAKVIVLALACAGLSIIFCTTMKMVSRGYKKYFPNTMVRALVGGSLVLALTFLVGSYDYNGAGMDVIFRATQGEAEPTAFLLKILFTALTLGAGFKGGEIVPAFFVGSTFGNVFGNLIGMNPSFGAGIGMAALFCGVTNCPLTSFILCIEIFGGKGLGYYALACAISYMLSGYYGLYSEQKIMYSKLKPVFINKNCS